MRWIAIAALLIACNGGPDKDPPAGGTPTGTAGGTTATTTTGGSTSTTTEPVTCPDEAGPLIETTTACYRGRVADGVEGFLGIGYAKPPVGDLRWAPPEVAAIQRGVVDALEIGSPCVQTNGTVDLELAAGDGSEDCLYLNVLRPEGTTAGDGLPVMVFVHGGSNTDGHGGAASMIGASFHRPPSDPPLIAEGPQLVNEQGAIVVTLNYRLGQLGFLAHPALTEASDDGASGNQALWDILRALQWVNLNAEALGGDPGRILLYGESAGSVNSCSLLSAAWTERWYDGVLLQSGVCTHVTQELDSAPLFGESAHEKGARMAAALGCTGDDAAQLACMRGKTTEEVMAVMAAGLGSLDLSAESYGPIVDGAFLAEPPADVFARGDFANVPVVLGVNRDEGTLFTTFAPVPGEAAFDLLLSGVALVYGWDAAGLQALYDPTDNYGGSVQDAYAAAYGDLVFVCPTRRLADTLAPHTDVRAYWWTHENPITAFLGAHHGVEISYTFGTGLDLGDQGAMNDVGTATWYAVGAGNPTVPGVGAWPLFGSSSPDGGTWVEMSLTPSVMATGPRKTQCDWMDP